MKNKLLTIVLVLAIVMSVFSGVCLVASAEEGESPNLLEMYGFNPGFNDGITPWKTGGTAAIESSDEDSADDEVVSLSVVSLSFPVPDIREIQTMAMIAQNHHFLCMG